MFCKCDLFRMQAKGRAIGNARGQYGAQRWPAVTGRGRWQGGQLSSMTVFLRSNDVARLPSRRVLAFGDLLAFLLFIILGRMSHTTAGPADWLLNAPRIGAPFLMGWAVAALIFGAYSRGRLSARRFLLNSLLAVLVADLIAFALRAYLFANNVTLAFALTTLAFTVLFVVGWRLLYLWACIARSTRPVES